MCILFTIIIIIFPGQVTPIFDKIKLRPVANTNATTNNITNNSTTATTTASSTIKTNTNQAQTSSSSSMSSDSSSESTASTTLINNSNNGNNGTDKPAETIKSNNLNDKRASVKEIISMLNVSEESKVSRY